MKTLIATAATLLISTGAYAFDSQNDLYGWAVFDGASFSAQASQPAVGSSSRSIVTPAHDAGRSQAGHPDNYGSILLDSGALLNTL